MSEDKKYWFNQQDDSSEASKPGRMSLSSEKYAALKPKSALGRCVFVVWDLVDLLRIFPGPFRLMSEHLKHGDSCAAVVVSTDPLLVAAYSEDMDCVAIQRFSSSFVREYGLSAGSRLLTVNFYGCSKEVEGDLVPGMRYTGVWTAFNPLIADFLTDDLVRLEQRKREIEEEEWEYVFELGCAYLDRFPGLYRDGNSYDLTALNDEQCEAYRKRIIEDREFINAERRAQVKERLDVLQEEARQAAKDQQD